MAVVPQVAVSWVVDLVNEYGTVSRAAAGEDALPLPGVALLGVAEAPPLRVDHRRLVQLADELHAVFAVAHRRVEFAQALNAVLRRTRPWPQVSAEGTAWATDGPDDQAEAQTAALAAGAALALLEFRARYGQQRLGLCAARRCADVYADTSAAGRRRFCSAVCANRHKVAAHRARQRPAKPSDRP